MAALFFGRRDQPYFTCILAAWLGEATKSWAILGRYCFWVDVCPKTNISDFYCLAV
jgi:hypothetical protein